MTRNQEKLTNYTSNIKKYLEDEDLLEDTLIRLNRAVDGYVRKPFSLTNTFASVISSLTREQYHENLGHGEPIHVIPTLIFSAYGMN